MAEQVPHGDALPLAITSLPLLGEFKRALKTELFRRSYGNAKRHSNIDIGVIHDTQRP